jgi:hypothetical protein
MAVFSEIFSHSENKCEKKSVTFFLTIKYSYDDYSKSLSWLTIALILSDFFNAISRMIKHTFHVGSLF